MVLFVLIAKYKLAPVRMILVGVALYAMLNGILELLAQDPFMKIPQGLTMKTWNDVYIVAITAIIGITLALILAQKQTYWLLMRSRQIISVLILRSID